MPQITYYAGSISQIVDGDRTWENLGDVNAYPSGTYGNTPYGAITTANLASEEITNNIVCTSFGAEKVVGTTLTYLYIVMNRDTSPGDHEDSEDIKDYEVFLTKNGTIISNNLASLYSPIDWTFAASGYYIPLASFSSLFLDGYGEDDLYDSGFGIKFNVTNVKVGSSSIKPLLYEVYITITHTSEFPKFIYNGDSTSEVYVTLDKNPEVTNSPTTYGLFHGNYIGYSTIYATVISSTLFFTEPNDNDPDKDLFNDNTPTYPNNNFPTVGFYPSATNYLDTTSYNDITFNYEVSDHIMNYDVSNLVVGETYRRGLALWYYSNFPYASLPIPIDVLWFNIDVIDSSYVEPEPEPPKYLYNGDSTSEVNITIDLNVDITPPTTTFYIDHGNDEALLATYPDSILSYTSYNLYTDEESEWPDEIYKSEFPSGGTGIGVYPNNYLDTPEVTIVRGVDSEWGSDTTTSHIMSYNYDSLVAGNLYRRGLVLWYKVTDSSGVVEDSGVYDTLFFNLTVVDTTLQPPYFIYNGFTNTEVNIILDKNPDVINPTTSFSIYHGDVIEPDGVNDIVNYSIGTYFTEPNINDPDSTSFIQDLNFDSTGLIGTYGLNYLSIDTSGDLAWDENSGIYESHTLSDHIMDYDITDLVVGETYRRALALVYYDTRISGSGTTLRYGVYDLLYFNIEVIDTSVITHPNRKNSGTFSNYII